MRSGWAPDWQNASTIIPELFGQTGGFNLSQVKDDAYEAKIQEAQKILDRAEQGKAWQELNNEAVHERVRDPARVRQGSVASGARRSATATSGRRTARWPSATCTSRASRVTVVAPGILDPRSHPPVRSPTAPDRTPSHSKRKTNVTAYVIRRVLTGLLILVLLSMLTFLLFSVLPSDPAALTCGKNCTPQVIEANRVRLGLDLPAVAAVLGVRQGPVRRPHLRLRAPRPSRARTLPGLLLPPGRGGHAADRQRPAPHDLPGASAPSCSGWSSASCSASTRPCAAAAGRSAITLGGALVGYSFPSFFIGLLLLFFVVIRWRLLPYPSYVPPTENPVQFFQTMILPWITLALLFAAFYIRLTRNQMLETLGEDYIRTARAKGLPEKVVIGKHGLRAGLTPDRDRCRPRPRRPARRRDHHRERVQHPGPRARWPSTPSPTPTCRSSSATVLVAGSIIVIANIIVDLLYAVIDPRVRLA